MSDPANYTNSLQNNRQLIRNGKLSLALSRQIKVDCDALLMFMSVHSWIFLGSWYCLCTDAARKTRSMSGLSYMALISGLDQSCRVLSDGLGVS